MSALAVVVAIAATGVSGLRWLRVAQREHYLPGMVATFAWRWWAIGPNAILLAAWVFGAALVAVGRPLPGAFGSAAMAVGPFGLSIRGRTSPLAWTRRLKTLAAVWAVLQLLLVAVGALLGITATAAVLGAGLVPLVVDAALALTAPIERRLAEPWVEKAKARLSQVRPTVVAITGSYGKTSTKGYLAALVEGTRQVVPSPRSFNNRAGLARAVNEVLVPGTEVFIAEMGTYGKGEIAELCSWCPPDVAVITAIGPVHLERMKTEENIAAAKAEILERARVAVLNVDNPHLARLTHPNIKRCSAVDPSADVSVIDGAVRVKGEPIGSVDPSLPPTNVACAVAAALEVGVPAERLAERLAALKPADHRLTTATGAAGFTIIDDTYNSNPAGGAVALRVLTHTVRDGNKRVVVTPGMVELGPKQFDANRDFAMEAARVATHVVVVGHTNRAALLEGAAKGTAQVIAVETREHAVEWVKANLKEGDGVLYENDLPDHFP